MPTIPGWHVVCGVSSSGMYSTTIHGVDCSLIGKPLGPTPGSTTPPTNLPAFWEFADGWTQPYPGYNLTKGQFGALWMPN